MRLECSRNQRSKNILYQRRHNRHECCADYNRHRQIHDVAAQNEVSEALYKTSSSPGYLL